MMPSISAPQLLKPPAGPMLSRASPRGFTIPSDLQLKTLMALKIAPLGSVPCSGLPLPYAYTLPPPPYPAGSSWTKHRISTPSYSRAKHKLLAHRVKVVSRLGCHVVRYQ